MDVQQLIILVAGAVAAAKPLPPSFIEFRGKASKMGIRLVVCVPSYPNEHVEKLRRKEAKIMIV
jgi:hypothetical protein